MADKLATQKYVDDKLASAGGVDSLPVNTILETTEEAGNIFGENWLKCDGSEIDPEDYPNASLNKSLNIVGGFGFASGLVFDKGTTGEIPISGYKGYQNSPHYFGFFKNGKIYQDTSGQTTVLYYWNGYNYFLSFDNGISWNIKDFSNNYLNSSIGKIVIKNGYMAILPRNMTDSNNVLFISNDYGTSWTTKKLYIPYEYNYNAYITDFFLDKDKNISIVVNKKHSSYDWADIDNVYLYYCVNDSSSIELYKRDARQGKIRVKECNDYLYFGYADPDQNKLDISIFYKSSLKGQKSFYKSETGQDYAGFNNFDINFDSSFYYLYILSGYSTGTYETWWQSNSSLFTSATVKRAGYINSYMSDLSTFLNKIDGKLITANGFSISDQKNINFKTQSNRIQTTRNLNLYSNNYPYYGFYYTSHRKILPFYVTEKIDASTYRIDPILPRIEEGNSDFYFYDASIGHQKIVKYKNYYYGFSNWNSSVNTSRINSFKTSSLVPKENTYSKFLYNSGDIVGDTLYVIKDGSLYKTSDGNSFTYVSALPENTISTCVELFYDSSNDFLYYVNGKSIYRSIDKINFTRIGNIANSSIIAPANIKYDEDLKFYYMKCNYGSGASNRFTYAYSIDGSSWMISSRSYSSYVDSIYIKNAKKTILSYDNKLYCSEASLYFNNDPKYIPYDGCIGNYKFFNYNEKSYAIAVSFAWYSPNSVISAPLIYEINEDLDLSPAKEFKDFLLYNLGGNNLLYINSINDYIDSSNNLYFFTSDTVLYNNSNQIALPTLNNAYIKVK